MEVMTLQLVVNYQEKDKELKGFTLVSSSSNVRQFLTCMQKSVTQSIIFARMGSSIMLSVS
eukprot:9046649-Ditylum_brightwellii.AAC.1